MVQVRLKSQQRVACYGPQHFQPQAPFLSRLLAAPFWVWLFMVVFWGALFFFLKPDLWSEASTRITMQMFSLETLEITANLYAQHLSPLQRSNSPFKAFLPHWAAGEPRYRPSWIPSAVTYGKTPWCFCILHTQQGTRHWPCHCAE